MLYIKKTVALFLLLISGYAASAQQQAMFTQYMFNGLLINPAYTGSHESLSMSALYRKQWTGLEGAPETQTFTAHSPLKYSKAAFGGMLVHDKIGVSDQYGVYGTYAYRIKTSSGTLSLGLQGGFTQYRANLTDLVIITENDAGDPVFFENDVSGFLPNVGTGIYFYNQRWYAGLSVPQLFNNSLQNGAENTAARQARHYFLSAGYLIDLSSQVKLKPNLLVKYAEGSAVQFDINANFLFKEILWVGGSYRSSESFSALVEIQISPAFAFGYAYDFGNTTSLGGVQNGSHEFMLNYRLKRKHDVKLSPRYF